MLLRDLNPEPSDYEATIHLNRQVFNTLQQIEVVLHI